MTNGKIDIAASRKKHEPSLSGGFFFLALELASRRALLERESTHVLGGAFVGQGMVSGERADDRGIADHVRNRRQMRQAKR